MSYDPSRPRVNRETNPPAVRAGPGGHHWTAVERLEPDVFGPAFWQTSVPFLLGHRASVWYANLAIHSLTEAKYGHDQTAASYRRALRYHGIAMSQLRKETTNRGTLQSATVCCLFFVIFAVMNSDHAAAQAHASSGCRMMSELYASRGANVDIGELMQKELQRALQFVTGQAHEWSQNASPLEDLKRDIRGWQPCHGGIPGPASGPL